MKSEAPRPPVSPECRSAARRSEAGAEFRRRADGELVQPTPSKGHDYRSDRATVAHERRQAGPERDTGRSVLHISCDR